MSLISQKTVVLATNRCYGIESCIPEMLKDAMDQFRTDYLAELGCFVDTSCLEISQPVVCDTNCNITIQDYVEPVNCQTPTITELQ